LALALPDTYAIAAVVIVTQTVLVRRGAGPLL
jgi:hypothetical protein